MDATYKRLGLFAVMFFGSIAGWAIDSKDVELVKAAQHRDWKTVRALAAQHININTPQADGATALQWTAHWDDLETAQVLIRAGGNVNAANDFGVTPLFLACVNASSKMVETLVAAGANPNSPLKLSGETPLMTCSRTGNVDAVKLLLSHRADPNVKERRKGQTALMWAIASGHFDVARVLVESGADIHAASTSGFTPLLFAAQQGDLESTRMLLDAGVNVNEGAARHGSPLVVASANGREGLALAILEQNADPNATDAVGSTALHFAVQKRKTELVKALLAHGANPNAKLSKDPPKMPGELGNFGSVKMAGATPFWLAAKDDNVEIMRVLADGGADPHIATADKTTPLMAASGIGWNFNTGFGVEGSDSTVLNALRVGVWNGAKLLLQLGADVNAVNESGLTALHGAAATGADAAIEFLVANGAKVDAKDKLGKTPLYYAERVDLSIRVFAQDSTADLLLKFGAVPLTDPAARRSHLVISTPPQAKR